VFAVYVILPRNCSAKYLKDLMLSVNIPYLQIADLMILLSLSIFILIHLTGVNLDAKNVDLSIDTFIVIPLCLRPHFSYLSYLHFSLGSLMSLVEQ